MVGCAVLLQLSAYAQKIEVIVDQDARCPGTSDQQAILGFLQQKNLMSLVSRLSAAISW
ncbi:MAG TPA: hypothetical protein VGK96_02505 [Candidatus Sulfotelmatobacter sp.]